MAGSSWRQPALRAACGEGNSKTGPDHAARLIHLAPQSRMLVARSAFLFHRQTSRALLPCRSALARCTDHLGVPYIGSSNAPPPPTARPLHTDAAAAMPSGELPAALQGLQPEALWRFFGELSAIPRPSKHEGRCVLRTCDAWAAGRCRVRPVPWPRVAAAAVPGLQALAEALWPVSTLPSAGCWTGSRALPRSAAWSGSR